MEDAHMTINSTMEEQKKELIELINSETNTHIISLVLRLLKSLIKRKG